MSPCPVCAGRLVVVGSRRRTRRTADGTRQVLVIRRLYCAARPAGLAGGRCPPARPARGVGTDPFGLAGLAAAIHDEAPPNEGGGCP